MKLFRRSAPATHFAFCETATAGPFTPHHIRALDGSGPKYGGGATTPALCGRDLGGGWDLTGSVDAVTVDALSRPRSGDGRVFLCPPCAEAWKEVTL